LKIFKKSEKKIQQKLAYATPFISMSCGMPFFAENIFWKKLEIFRNFQKFSKNLENLEKKIQQKLAYATPFISMSCGMPIFAEFFFGKNLKISENLEKFQKLFKNFLKFFEKI
jgi:hypothetical protein